MQDEDKSCKRMEKEQKSMEDTVRRHSVRVKSNWVYSLDCRRIFSGKNYICTLEYWSYIFGKMQVESERYNLKRGYIFGKIYVESERNNLKSEKGIYIWKRYKWKEKDIIWKEGYIL